MNRRNNRRGDGERLRTELLDAAAALVEESGPGALSLRAVAGRVGVAATSVYLHFDDLDALRGALAQRWFVDFAAARDTAAAGIDDPVRALVVRCQAYARYALAHPGRYRLMFGPDQPPMMVDGVDSPSRDAFEALVGSIRRCRDAAAMPADADPRRTALLVWTALHGQVTLRMDRPQFRWPALDGMVAELVTRLAAIDRSPAEVSSSRPRR
jgi:AcrR family transcriptional regulator